jgi:hypothetical protein
VHRAAFLLFAEIAAVIARVPDGRLFANYIQFSEPVKFDSRPKVADDVRRMRESG